MTPVEYDEDFTGMRFLLEAEGAAAFDDITRDGQVRTLKGQSRQRLAQHLPQFAPDSRRGVHPRAAGPHAADREIREVHGGLGRHRDSAGSFLTTTNLTGNPQVVAKCGFVKAQNGNDQPLTIGFLGRIYEEGSPLRVALAYEQATQWHNRHPMNLGV